MNRSAYIVSILRKVIAMGAHQGAHRRSENLADNSDAELVTRTIHEAVIFRPVLDVAGIVLGIICVSQGVGTHSEDLVGDGVVQARFVALAVDSEFMFGATRRREVGKDDVRTRHGIERIHEV